MGNATLLMKEYLDIRAREYYKDRMTYENNWK